LLAFLLDDVQHVAHCALGLMILNDFALNACPSTAFKMQ
jgi:hypothetical protein